MFPQYNPKSNALQNNAVDTWYQKRESTVTASKKTFPRKVFLDNPKFNEDSHFVSNIVVTSKYTVFNFLYKFLLKEFSQTANFYFFIVGIGQLIPLVSTTNGVPIIWGTLALVIAIDGIFDVIADLKLHKADHIANNTKTLVLNRNTSEFEKVSWSDVKVGDFVKVILAYSKK